MDVALGLAYMHMECSLGGTVCQATEHILGDLRRLKPHQVFFL